MGSSSDHEIMSEAATILEKFGIEYEINVVSAHRTPEAMVEYGLSAKAVSYTHLTLPTKA